jgi:hypothetical protein
MINHQVHCVHGPARPAVAAQMYLEMQVRAGGVTRRSNEPDHVPDDHGLPDRDQRP